MHNNMDKRLIKLNKGFTLVELLVVIAIIAILAAVGFTVFTGTQASARNSARKADVEAISKAWETKYDATTAKYPQLTTGMFAGGAFPRDPSTGAAYAYTGCSTGQCANEGQNGDTYKVCTISMESGVAQYCREAQQK